MQDMKTRELRKFLVAHGYKESRSSGSHTVFIKTMTSSISIPTGDTVVCGALAKGIEKRVNHIDELALRCAS